MKMRKVYLIVQSVLCVALALLLTATAIGMYREGAAAKAADPLAQIYTAEKVAERFRPFAPLFLTLVCTTLGGLILGVKDEKGSRPVKCGGLQNSAAAGERTLRLILLIAALGLIAAGALSGGARDVFRKAVKICTECVGLG